MEAVVSERVQLLPPPPQRTAPRKDLNKVAKRKRPSTAARSGKTMFAPDKRISDQDMELLLASLTCDETAQMEPPPLPLATSATPQVHYYTYAQPTAAPLLPMTVPTPPLPPPPPPPAPETSAPPMKKKKKNKRDWDPRLLIRQIYKLITDACAVIGLECLPDYKPAIYLVNDECSVQLSFEDLIALRSARVMSIVDGYFTHQRPLVDASTTTTTTTYLDTVAIECTPLQCDRLRSITVCNYRVHPKKKSLHESGIFKEEACVRLHLSGWLSLKRYLDCMEAYYNICAESSPAVQCIVSRYRCYLTKHYKPAVFQSDCGGGGTGTSGGWGEPINLDPDVVQHITTDLPLLLLELNERRLPSVEIEDCIWYYKPPTGQLRPSTLAWLDAEVRRHCVPYLVDVVLDNLRYYHRW